MPLVIGVTKEFDAGRAPCCACSGCSQEISRAWGGIAAPGRAGASAYYRDEDYGAAELAADAGPVLARPTSSCRSSRWASRTSRTSSSRAPCWWACSSRGRAPSGELLIERRSPVSPWSCCPASPVPRAWTCCPARPRWRVTSAPDRRRPLSPSSSRCSPTRPAPSARPRCW